MPQTLRERLVGMLDKRWVRFLCFAVSGLVTGLCLVFPVIGMLEWLSLIPMALCLWRMAGESGMRLRALYGYGVFFFFCFGLAVFHFFIGMYPLDFVPGLDAAGAVSVVLLGWVGLSAFQAVQGGLMFVLLALLLRSRIGQRLRLLRPCFFGGLWVIYEWWLTQGWFGVPWGRLALGQTALAVGLQTASLLGCYLITFLLVTVNASLAAAILYADGRRLFSGMAVVCLLFQYGVGSVLYLTGRNSGEPVTVSAVQGNLSSRNASGGGSASETLAVYREYTRKAAAEGAELVVWPETALTYTVTENGKRWETLADLAKECEVTLLVGAFTRDGEGKQYNSVICFLPDGSASDAIYSKRHLVPFGEYVPMREVIELLLPSLSELVLSSKDTSAGADSEIFQTPVGGIGSILCYDSVFEELTRDSARDGGELICISTNDSWFLDSAALSMHLAQAQLRAVETGRYVVRAGNTGITAVITSRGEITERLTPLQEGALTAEVYPSDTVTPYVAVGNLLVYLWLFAVVGILAHSFYDKKIKKRLTKRQENAMI